MCVCVCVCVCMYVCLAHYIGHLKQFECFTVEAIFSLAVDSLVTKACWVVMHPSVVSCSWLVRQQKRVFCWMLCRPLKSVVTGYRGQESTRPASCKAWCSSVQWRESSQRLRTARLLSTHVHSTSYRQRPRYGPRIHWHLCERIEVIVALSEVWCWCQCYYEWVSVIDSSVIVWGIIMLLIANGRC